MIHLLLGFHYSHAQNQEYIFKHITVSDGLVNNIVTALCTDSEGFMWIGTQAGLQRFDGTRFKNFLADIRDTAALQTDWIGAIFEDSKKRLWIGTDHGAPYLLNRVTGKFINYNLHASPGNKVNGTWHFAEDKKGNIWLAGHEGFYKLNAQTNQFEKWNDAMGLLKTIHTGNLTIDSKENLWLCSKEGISFYNTSEKILYNSLHNPARNPLFDIKEVINNILITPNNIWVSTGSRTIYRYETVSHKLKAFAFSMRPSNKLGPSVQTEITGFLYALQNGQIVIPLLERGLAIYHPEDDSFHIVEADNSRPYLYHTEYGAEHVLQDKEKNILIGNSTGINIYNPEKQLFFNHAHAFGKYESFPNTIVNDFLELPNSDILIAYYNFNGGIVRTDSAFVFKKHYLFKENGSENSSVNMIWNLFRDDKEIIWAPNQKQSVLKLNPVTNGLQEDLDPALKGSINTIKQDSGGNLWIGHWSKGLGRINTIKHTQDYYTSFLYAGASTSKRVYSILVDVNKIWVGTFQNGLQVFDKQSEKYTSAFTVNEKDKNSISSNSILDIVRYNKDTILLATEMGVNIFDTRRNTFKAITVKEGLPNNLVIGMMLDKNSNLWVVCSGGFCKINMHNLAITNFDIYDGIIDNNFSGRIYGLKNGNALIADSKSFISFNPSGIAASKPPSRVVITGFSVFGKEIFLDSLHKNNLPVQLSYSENSLRIEFASLDFWASGNIKYFYKLGGVDEDWIQADKNQAAVYNQLKYGKYNFEVKCINRDGIYCKEITWLTINMNPPFWKTWWFYLLLFFIGIIMIWQFIKWRERNIKAIQDEKLKVEQLNADQYKSKLELEQIINYFSSSLINKTTVDDVLQDVANKLIGRLGFEDCMIYLWNQDKTKMTPRAGHGQKGSAIDILNRALDIPSGAGLVGKVIQTKESFLIRDTNKDAGDGLEDRSSLNEIGVPVIYDAELIGVIQSEHHLKNFFTTRHLEILSTIASMMGNKIKSIEAEKSLQQANIQMLGINEKLSEAKLAALRSQMNPHFIFNSLNAIQECILTNKIDAAYEYLSEFSKLQRMVLNNSAKEFITLGSEIEMLKLYLSLESLRFSRSFNYSITIEKNTDADDITLPSMLIQPYVENSIWHGLRNKDGQKFLNVHCEESKGILTITIDDNGVGRNEAQIIKSQKLGVDHTISKGTILTEERISILSMKYKSKITVMVIDKENEKREALGTKVIITLPTDIGGEKF